MLKKEEAIPWPGTLAIVHSYIAYKAGRKTILGLIFFPFWKMLFWERQADVCVQKEIKNWMHDSPQNQEGWGNLISLYAWTCTLSVRASAFSWCDPFWEKAERSHLQGIIEAIDSFFTAKEEEKQKLLKWSSDLKQEREQLEQKVKQLSNSITVSTALPNDCLHSLHCARSYSHEF